MEATRYADGRPVAGCRVLVLHPAFDPMRETHCDAAGRYRLELAPDVYNAIAILDEGYGKTTLELTGQVRHMRVALLQVPRPALAAGPHVVRVRITDARSGALGEGTIAVESNSAGLGF